jgi:hypothetical protein
MSRIAVLLLAALALAACGSTGRPQADQDRDGRQLASALQTAMGEGSAFKLDQQLVLTGGDIPSGKEIAVHATVSDGMLRNGTARFSYRITQGKQTVTYDMLVSGGRLFVRHHGGSGWKVTPLPAATSLFPALRLDLVRETVLLASAVSTGTVTHVDAGFARKYAVRPAPDQLEELESVPVQGQAETQFLKTATAEVDVFLVYPGDRLGRVEVHLSGTDPSSGIRQQVQSSIDVRTAKVATIQEPGSAQPVSPGDVLS